MIFNQKWPSTRLLNSVIQPTLLKKLHHSFHYELKLSAALQPLSVLGKGEDKTEEDKNWGENRGLTPIINVDVRMMLTDRYITTTDQDKHNSWHTG